MPARSATRVAIAIACWTTAVSGASPGATAFGSAIL
jgi:hypothetical protein